MYNLSYSVLPSKKPNNRQYLYPYKDQTGLYTENIEAIRHYNPRPKLQVKQLVTTYKPYL